MNPFDLRGPEFLVFYALLGLATLAALTLVRRAWESSGGRARLSDPYLIAYLRGGVHDALRVATVALVDRGLLQAGGMELKTADADAVKRASHPLEKAILEKFQTEDDPRSLFHDLSLEGAARPLERALEERGLIPDDAVRQRRLMTAAVAVLFLWGVAAIKAAVAVSREHYNLWFLLALALGLAFVALRQSPARTRAGDRVLDELRELFGGLRTRAGSLRRGSGAEAALVAAVFGVRALPVSEWAFAYTLQPRVERKDASSSSSSGSSCGSSGGSSCGSSCGGSCGGGCGGCGG